MPTSTSSPLARYAELEARYDGPMPARGRDILRHGSTLAADIAATRGEIMFFREMAARARRSGKAWRARGHAALAARALADARIYLAAWRTRRRRLKALRGQSAETIGTLEAIAGDRQ